MAKRVNPSLPKPPRLIVAPLGVIIFTLLLGVVIGILLPI